MTNRGAESHIASNLQPRNPGKHQRASRVDALIIAVTLGIGQAVEGGFFVNEFEEMMKSPLQRRAFLGRMSSAGLGVAATSLVGGTLLAGCNGDNDSGGPTPNPTGTPGGTPGPTGTPNGGGLDPQNFPGIVGDDINEVVLNFALALEILEADLYRQALNVASGKPITAPLSSDQNSYRLAISPGSLSPSSGQAAADAFLFLKQFTFVEVAHRDFLRTAIRSLGGTPQPANPGGYKFPNGPGNDLKTILANIIPLEETGVRAYLGAAPFLTDLGLIQTAATIFSTEARHSAVINDALGRDPGPTPMPGDEKVTPNYPSPNTFEYFLPPRVVLQRVAVYFVKTTTT